MTPLEIEANVMVTLSIVLAGRNSIHTWWTGIEALQRLGARYLTVHGSVERIEQVLTALRA